MGAVNMCWRHPISRKDYTVASWRLAPSLYQLLAEVNQLYPRRSKSHDGTIGDRKHRARRSEHNPNSRGQVLAMDITVNPLQARTILNRIVGDSRVHYVIYNRRIYNRHYGWTPRVYNGVNPHKNHIHVSLRNDTTERASRAEIDAAFSDRRTWLGVKTGATRYRPVVLLKEGVYGRPVADLQRGLNEKFNGRYKLTVDGKFGPATKRAVADFQMMRGLAADGIVGAVTRAELAKFGIVI